MKKNININLFGTLYAIDEDACTLLENYLDNMRSYFAKRDGGDEIFDDIEHRVAEHLWSLKENGMTAIDIDTVKQIISSIGNPDEMESEVEEVADSKIEETSDAEADSEDKEQSEGEDQGEGECKDNGQSEGKAQSESNSNASNDTYTNAKAEAIGGKWTDRVLHHVSTHRFYRDGKDKIGGGVISGLCHYCGGGDIVVWRVGIVLFLMAAFALNQTLPYCFISPLLVFLFFVPIIIYIVLWLVAPVARTTEERLSMTGKEVTPESISKAIIAEAEEQVKPTIKRGKGGGILSGISEIVKFSIKAVALISFSVLIAFALAYFIFSIAYVVIGEPFIRLFTNDNITLSVMASIPYMKFYIVVSALCCFIAALFPLLLIVRSFKSEPKPTRTGIIAMLSGIWVVAVTLGFIMFVMIGIQMQKKSREYNRLENTHNGIYMNRNNWELTSQNGWDIEVAKNFGETIYGWSDADPLCMDMNPIRIRADKSNLPIEFAMSRKEAKEEGDYMLECLSSCSVVDATLSVWSEGKCLSVLRLDGYGSASNIPLKGLLWEESRKIPLLCQQNDSTTWVDDVVRNDAWRYLSTAPFRHKGGILEYRLRIGQHDVKDIVTNGGYVKMVHEGLRKQ
ncbi:PspC domain-containing protein [Prevotella stercorea]|uniref:PspC domain-containing protein n=1 Tax=Leyella stercorea TaxID=363265 RepID=UPI001F2B77B2|nr:PspC domain-containing protein [Leyella stercorea]MCF2577963.1 PspC domain-containing protein [Leyella stercorea]